MKKDSVSKLFLKPVIWWVLLLLVAVITRFYQLGVTPVGITWDEAAIAYNGWSVWTVYRDEWLHLLPVSFQSFGDYKAPLAMYLVGPFILLGGPQPFFIRLPFALVGVITIFAIGWLVWELLQLFNKEKADASWWALLASFLVTFSPWHHHFSRVGFESGLALGAVSLGMAFFVRWLRLVHISTSQKKPGFSWLLLVTLCLAVAGFSASFYAYHSAKIVVPLLGLISLVLWFHIIKKQLLMVVIAAGLGVCALTPFLYDSVYKSGAERLQQVTVFTQGKPIGETVITIAQQYGEHWSPRFLVQGKVDSLRHGDGSWGIFFYTDFLLFLGGLVGFALLGKFMNQSTDQRFILLARFGLLWVLVGLIPPALGMDGIPHSNRAFLALPGFIMINVAGAQFIMRYIHQLKINKTYLGSHGEDNIVLKSFVGTWVLLHLVFFATYVNHYYTKFKAESSDAFQAGYRELMATLLPLEKEQAWDKLLISSAYGQPYIYTLLFHGYSPYRYHGGVLINYEFAPIKVGDLNRTNTIIVASPADHDSEWLPQPPDKIITDSVGQERFWIYLRR